MATITTTIIEETRLGIDPPSSYLYGSCRFDDKDDDDDDDDSGDYLNAACPVTAAALKEDDDEQEHPWDEDWDIPLLSVKAAVSLQIKGFADKNREVCDVSQDPADSDKGALNESQDDDFSDCPTVKQGNRQPEASKPLTTGAQESPKGAESDSEESDDTATTEEDEEEDENDTSQEQQQHVLQDHSHVLGVKKERTNSWFRSWWNKDSSHEQQEQAEEDEEDEINIIIKPPAAIVLDDTDHDGFAIDSALALPMFDDRHHPWQQHQSLLNFELDDDLEYEAAQNMVKNNNNIHQHFLLNFENDSDCSEDMDIIEICDSDDSEEEEEEHDLGINNNNSNSAAPCTPPLPTKPLVALPKSALKTNEAHDKTKSNNKKHRVSFNIPENSASDAATAATTVDHIVPIVDTMSPPTSPKWKLRQWKRRQTQTRTNHAQVVPREAAIVKETAAASSKNNNKDRDGFHCRNMKLLRRFRNRSAVKLLQDYQ